MGRAATRAPGRGRLMLEAGDKATQFLTPGTGGDIGQGVL